jgi:hypothetical protein
MMKPVQFFGRMPELPSKREGFLGAAVQFVIPGLTVSGQDLEVFRGFALGCGESVESTWLERVQGEASKEPGTFVSITFHQPVAADAQDAADTAGRLIAERFLSVASYLVGLRLVAHHLQVSTENADGTFTARQHPNKQWTEPSRKVDLPAPMALLRPSPDVFKVLFWLRRGLSGRDPLDAFAALLVALEILASLLVPEDDVVSRCKHCGEELGRRTTHSLKHLVTDVLGASPELFHALWSTRNAVVAHGGRAVTADVLREVVRLRLEAIRLVFRSVALALGLPAGIEPEPAPIVFFEDPFLHAQ